VIKEKDYLMYAGNCVVVYDGLSGVTHIMSSDHNLELLLDQLTNDRVNQEIKEVRLSSLKTEWNASSLI